MILSSIITKMGLLLGTSLMLVSIQPAGGIKGTVQPAEAVNFVYAITGTDTLKTSLQSGNFQFAKAQPGTYRVIFMAKPPFKMMIKDDIIVKDGETVDMGVIRFKR